MPETVTLRSAIATVHSRGRLVALLIGVALFSLSEFGHAAPNPVHLAQADDELEQDLAAVRQLLQRGTYGEAEEYLADLEGEKGVWPLRWRLLRETGRGEEGKQYLEQTAAFRAGDPDALVAVASQDQARGRYERAVELLERALEKDADHVEARARLGQIHMASGKRDEAEAEFEKLIAHYKKLSTSQARALGARGFVWLGKACEGLNRFGEAYQVMYSSALDLEPESIDAHVAAGWTLLEKYNYPDARSHFQDALNVNPEHAEAQIGLAYATYADLMFPRNRFGATIQALSSAERVWPDHPDLKVLRGHLAFYGEDWPVALEFYQAAVAHQPKDLAYRAHVAMVYYATHRMEEFEALTKSVEASHPKPAEYFATIGDRLTDRFFYEEAANYARRAIEIDPDYWPAYVTLGINALRIGNDTEGKLYVEKAFENDKFNVWAFNTRILIRHIERNFVETKTQDFLFRFHEQDEAYLLPYLRPLMERAKERMEAKYQVDISEPIIFEDFSDHAYFSARSIGLPGLAASGVCFGKLVTLTTPRAIPGNWGAVAIHEFAHVIALQKTQHRVPRWLTEGLSTFEEDSEAPRWRRRFADEFVQAVEYDLLLPLEELPSGFTKPDFSGRILLSYYQGSMICHFLTERFGFEKIVEMLARYRVGDTTDQVLRKVLDWSYADFDREFFAWCRAEAKAMGLGPQVPGSRLTTLRFAAQDAPQSIERWIELGFGYYFNQKIADAELAIGRALKLGEAPNGDLEALQGFVKIQQRRSGTAKGHLERAIELGTRYPYRAHIALAMIAESNGENEKAIEHFERAIEIHPTGSTPRFGSDRNPYYHASDLYLKIGDEEKAVAVLERLIEVDNDDAEVRKRVAQHYRAKGDWEKVVSALWDAVYINPYDFVTHRLLAEGYLETKQYEKALVNLRILALDETAPLDWIYGKTAVCYLELGQPDRAREQAERALQINGRQEDALEVMKRLE